MDPVLATVLVGLITAAAALIGSRLSSESTNKTLSHTADLERARWEREDRNRHEETRRSAYPKFLAIVDEGVHRVNAVLNGRELVDALPAEQWRERERVALAVIEFVGTRDTIDTAVRLDRAARRLITGATGLVNASLEHVHEHESDDEPADDEEWPEGDTADEEQVPEGDTAADDEELPEGDTAQDDDRPSMSDAEAEARAAEFAHGRLVDENDPMTFLNILPYPLGDDPDQQRMYGGQPFFQISMARAELRIRRHEFVNAARADLGMDLLDYPAEGTASDDDGGQGAAAEATPPDEPAPSTTVSD